MGERALREQGDDAAVVRLPGVELRLTAEYALRAAIDNQVFAALRDLEPLDGGRAVQAVYIALMRRLPNVIPDRKRIAVDSGYSESSVKRAIKLLEQCRLIVVERKRGFSSVYHLADIRSVEVASDCVAAIRKLSRTAISRASEEGRVTSEPTRCLSRAICEPSSRVTSEPDLGPQVNPKVATKNQDKQQRVDAFDENEELAQVLKRWGLVSASYLVKPGHKRAIPVLVENPALAARLIDATMKRAVWSPDAGVGSRVAFLRENVGDAVAKRTSDDVVKRKREADAFHRAKAVAESLRDVPIPADFDENGSNALIERGLNRLGESEAVCRLLRENPVVRKRLLAEELLRDSIEQAVASMTVAEFNAECESLFDTEPGLRRLYGSPNRESVGLRLRLVAFLLEQEGKKGRGRFGNRACGVSEQSGPIVRSGRP